jgi:4'-phosphopantetheinyl transferase
VSEYLELLPVERREKVIRYRNLYDKKLSIVVYLLLKYAMKIEYGIIDEFEFNYGYNGKPYLKDYPNIFFNLSHCNSGAVCVLAECEIGIDIQNIIPFDWNLANKVCCNEELKVLKISNNKERDFCKMWACKESYIKMIGKGLTIKLSDIDTLGISEIYTVEKNDCWITVMTSKCFQKIGNIITTKGDAHINIKDAIKRNSGERICIKNISIADILDVLG